MTGATACSNNGDTTLALRTIALVFSIRPLRLIARPFLIPVGYQILAIIFQVVAALRFTLVESAAICICVPTQPGLPFLSTSNLQ